MYKRMSSGCLKHYDFILLDMVCLQISFVLAYMLRVGELYHPFWSELYRGMALVLAFADIVIVYSNGSFSGVLKRGYYKEFTATVRHAFLVSMLGVFYLFATQSGEAYSRLTYGMMAILYVLLSYVARIGWKAYLKHHKLSKNKKSLVILTTKAEAEEIIAYVKKEMDIEYAITGVVIVDCDRTGRKVAGIPVVAGPDSVANYICHHWVDEVLVHAPSDSVFREQMIDDIAETGVIVHISMSDFVHATGRRYIVEQLGTEYVLTTSINYMSQKQAFAKRMLDILGGFVGCILTGILFLFIAPAICIASPGPVLFSQVRVGKNGKKFKMYKFRSMYVDAEERKKELQEQNRCEDGMMFKLDFDPRIIGNKILPDGRKKTGIGDFLRRTSLDEFPQFFNVLRGDMSLVGTRPPTVDEWEKYELHHRARLATRPGITGLWQVRGRSQITDFEEVVKLDTQYINEWSMGLDLRILFKTIGAVLKKDGSM